jgi:hypothetical protein
MSDIIIAKAGELKRLASLNTNNAAGPGNIKTLS